MAERSRGLVVVVEDEQPIADLLKLYLERDGFEVAIVADGTNGLRVIQDRAPIAAILDVGLPGMSGTDVCSALRAEQNWTPVLFCTARDDEIDRVLGLELGADDYITKPFSPREVVARVKAVLRRSANKPAVQEEVTLGMHGVEVDTSTRRASVNGEEVELTPTEFDLLVFLLRNPSKVFSRDELLTDVWGYSSAVGSRTVDVHVAQLRAKLEPTEIIRTVRGVGYSVDERTH
jgi:DNA-binding response OmpR family regulator